MNGVFVSDLHLFSSRSVGTASWDSLRPQLSQAECVVLGGDIFDFRWSKLDSFDASLDAAESWIDQQVANHPGARWMYVLGNHDCQPAFCDRLERLRKRHAGFDWHPSHWRVGDHLFLHGDMLEGNGSPQGWSRFRQRFHEIRSRGRVQNVLYQAAVHSRLHGVVPRWRHTPNRTCRRMLTRIGNWHPTLLDGLRHIVFGHTHVPMAKRRFATIDFHNAGSAVRHLPFRPIWFDID